MESKKQIPTESTNANNGTQSVQGNDLRGSGWSMVSLLLVFYDVVAVNLAYFLSLWLRYDCQYTAIPTEYLAAWFMFAPLYGFVCFVAFKSANLYHSLWRFASYDELIRILVTTLVTGAFHGVFITLFFSQMPTSYYIVSIGIQFFLVLSVRFAYRFILMERRKLKKAKQSAIASRVMLIGAGNAGRLILGDIQSAKEVNDTVCCIIDDDKSKWGKYINGVPIVGGREDILLNVSKYRIEKIYLAIPSASAEARRDILNICKESNCELKNLPGVYQFVAGDVQVSAMQDVKIEDLLGRKPVSVQVDEIYGLISDKVVLVTGGGGSIGSELCRQIARHNPKTLIVFDIYENNAHAIQLELRDQYPELDLEVLIGSVRDSRRLNQVFARFHPDVVFHAAAHKHVPLMEDSPCESIKNNAIGTYKTAYAAMAHNCKRFVLISTDKAVNPTNIMGASKRLCEMIVQTFDKNVREGKFDQLPPIYTHGEDITDSRATTFRTPISSQTEFVAVRFGNVLGSNGSVVPHFKEQIAHGGPVTVTHPDIIRYFMTIPEAASLVLQAGAYANGGEIFVLDMGSPVKIDTLARNLIRLSGLRPDIDIKIEYTGLRPGEKLYEEKLMSEEGMRTTPNQLIHIGCPIPFDEELFMKQLLTLIDVAYAGDDEKIRTLVAEAVPTYHPAGAHGSEEKGEAFRLQMKDVEASEEAAAREEAPSAV